MHRDPNIEYIATVRRDQVEEAIRRKVQTAYLGRGIVLSRILGSHKIFLHSDDRGFACHLMLDGYWEMWLTQFLARYVKSGMTVIDVGANYGYFSLLLGAAVGESGKLVAIEPNPRTVALLQETLALNGFSARSEIIPNAVGAQAGAGWLYSPHGEPKNAALVDSPDIPGGSTSEVPITTIDDLLSKYPRIDAVKIDAEGGEPAILTGMQALMARDHPLIVLEFNAARYPDPAEVLDGVLRFYGDAKELALDGFIRPLDRASVLDRNNLFDRVLVFGLPRDARTAPPGLD
jgi:FkbM family methyltransferase